MREIECTIRNTFDNNIKNSYSLRDRTGVQKLEHSLERQHTQDHEVAPQEKYDTSELTCTTSTHITSSVQADLDNYLLLQPILHSLPRNLAYGLISREWPRLFAGKDVLQQCQLLQIQEVNRQKERDEKDRRGDLLWWRRQKELNTQEKRLNDEQNPLEKIRKEEQEAMERTKKQRWMHSKHNKERNKIGTTDL